MDSKEIFRVSTKRNKGCFKKGHVGFKGFLGKKHSEKTCKLLSDIAIEQKRSVSFKGRKHTDETKRKISEKNKGSTPHNKGKPSPLRGTKLSEEVKNKISLSHIGIKHADKTKQKLRNINLGKKHPEFSGEKHPRWKGGVTKLNDIIRKSPEYIKWRKDVFERDNYTCVLCGINGVTLNADHIKRFSNYPKLRTVLSNGRTLCVPCHKKTPTWGNYKK